MSRDNSSSNQRKPAAVAIGTALTGLLLSGSAFAMNPLVQGYLLGTGADAGEKAAEGKCGEGKCGMEKMDTDKDGKLSQAEFAAAHDGDSSKFAAHDPNGDGFVDAAEMKAHHDAKRSHDKASMEGKCGEGKCGEGKCGGAKQADTDAAATPAADAAEAADAADATAADADKATEGNP